MHSKVLTEFEQQQAFLNMMAFRNMGFTMFLTPAMSEYVGYYFTLGGIDFETETHIDANGQIWYRLFDASRQTSTGFVL